MTFLGKIFTVLVFVMSVVFMTAAVTVYATHVNWNKVVDNASPGPGEQLGLKQQVLQQKQTNERLRDELDRALGALAAEQAARRQILANLYSDLDQLRDALRQKETQLAGLQSAHGVAVETLRMNENTLTSLTAEVDTLRSEIQVVLNDRDDKLDRILALTDSYNSSQGLVRQMTERGNDLAAMLTRMKNVMDKFGLTPDTPTSPIPPPLDGYVVQVGERDLIEISLGSDDGLREGHELDVFRQGTYLGRIKVLEAGPDRSVASIIRKEQSIKKGDGVSTRLSLG